MSNQISKEIELRKAIVAAVYELATQDIFKNAMGESAVQIAAIEAINVKNLLTPSKFMNDNQTKVYQSLLMCSPQSWQKVVFDAVILGLSLNPIKKHCAVVPYGDTASLMPMVGGYLHLLYGNNIIKSCTYNAVYSKDKFHLRQPLLPQTVANNFLFEKSINGRGEFIGAYCFFTLQNGEYVGDFLDAEQIEKRRKSAKTDFIWKAWFDEMVEKTIVHYVKKQIPATTKMLELDQSDYQHVDLEKLNQIESTHTIIIKEQTEEQKQKQEDAEILSQQWVDTFKDELAKFNEYMSFKDALQKILKSDKYIFVIGQDKEDFKTFATERLTELQNEQA